MIMIIIFLQKISAGWYQSGFFSKKCPLGCPSSHSHRRFSFFGWESVLWWLKAAFMKVQSRLWLLGESWEIQEVAHVPARALSLKGLKFLLSVGSFCCYDLIQWRNSFLLLGNASQCIFTVKDTRQYKNSLPKTSDGSTIAFSPKWVCRATAASAFWLLPTIHSLKVTAYDSEITETYQISHWIIKKKDARGNVFVEDFHH